MSVYMRCLASSGSRRGLHATSDVWGGSRAGVGRGGGLGFLSTSLKIICRGSESVMQFTLQSCSHFTKTSLHGYVLMPSSSHTLTVRHNSQHLPLAYSYTYSEYWQPPFPRSTSLIGILVCSLPIKTTNRVSLSLQSLHCIRVRSTPLLVSFSSGVHSPHRKPV